MFVVLLSQILRIAFDADYRLNSYTKIQNRPGLKINKFSHSFLDYNQLKLRARNRSCIMYYVRMSILEL